MLKAENVIATALKYMRSTPPQVLLDLMSSKCNASLVLDTIAMFNAPPAWSFRPHAPSDYALLKRAEELRAAAGSAECKRADEEPRLVPTFAGSGFHPYVARYPLSYAALGCYSHPKLTCKPTLKFVTCLVVVLVAILVAIYSSCGSIEHVSIYQRLRVAQKQGLAAVRVPINSIVSLNKPTSDLSSPLAVTSPINSLFSRPPSIPVAVAADSELKDFETETIRDNTTVDIESSSSFPSRAWVSALVKVVGDASVSTSYYAPYQSTSGNGSETIFYALAPASPWITAFVRVIEDSVPFTHI
jgi:hypothetical protein